MLSLHEGHVRFDPHRCTRCGACLAACHKGVISLREEGAEFQIVVDTEKCVLCLRCIHICPAEKLPEQPLRDADFAETSHICLAAARNPQVRYHASSGGVARELARAALENGLVDAVYGVRRIPEPPFYAGGYLFDPGEAAEMANSVYYAFPFAAGLRKKPEGRQLKRLLFIGTNCQIQAAEAFYKGTPTELLKVAILCKQQKTPEFVHWLRREMGTEEDRATPVSFRGQGWPGTVRCGGKTLSPAFYSTPFGMELWRVPGCRFCANLLGRDADITLFDPWNLVVTEGSAGFDAVMLRTEAARALWEAARGRLEEWGKIPLELALRPHLAGRPLTGEDVKTSIDWWRYRRTKVDALPFYLGRERTWHRRFGYAMLERLRQFNGWLFLRVRNKKIQSLATLIWGKGSKALLMLVEKR